MPPSAIFSCDPASFNGLMDQVFHEEHLLLENCPLGIRNGTLVDVGGSIAFFLFPALSLAMDREDCQTIVEREGWISRSAFLPHTS